MDRSTITGKRKASTSAIPVVLSGIASKDGAISFSLPPTVLASAMHETAVDAETGRGGNLQIRVQLAFPAGHSFRVEFGDGAEPEVVRLRSNSVTVAIPVA